MTSPGPRAAGCLRSLDQMMANGGIFLFVPLPFLCSAHRQARWSSSPAHRERQRPRRTLCPVDPSQSDSGPEGEVGKRVIVGHIGSVCRWNAHARTRRRTMNGFIRCVGGRRRSEIRSLGRCTGGEDDTATTMGLGQMNSFYHICAYGVGFCSR